MKKEAFTLAETLIALAVLSVIFSLTVPYFVLAHHKHITAIKLKKSYSALSRTINLSQAYNSSISDWDTSLNGKEFFNKYFRSYLNVVNEYSSSQLKKIAPRKNLNGTDYVGKLYNNANAYHFALLDGSLISTHLNSTSENGIWVGIDINGIEKPNKVGSDTFLFFFSPMYGLKPLGDKGTPSNWSFNSYNRKKLDHQEHMLILARKRNKDTGVLL